MQTDRRGFLAWLKGLPLIALFLGTAEGHALNSEQLAGLHARRFCLGPNALISEARFDNCKILICDGDQFVNCLFVNCEIEMRGGALVGGEMRDGNITCHAGYVGLDSSGAGIKRLPDSVVDEMKRMGQPGMWNRRE